MRVEDKTKETWYNTTDMITDIQKRVHVSRKTINEIYNEMVRCIIKNLNEGKVVYMTKFIKFRGKKHPPTQKFCYLTKKQIQLPERVRIATMLLKSFKDKINPEDLLKQ